MRLPRQCVHIQHNGCARDVVQVISFESLNMRKILPQIILLFFTVLLTLAGGVYWISQNQDKTEAVVLQALSDRLKTDSNIASIRLDIWSSFPHVSIILSDVHLMGSGANADTLLQARELSLECNAWKLIQGKYQLQALQLEDAQIHLKQNSNGKWNTEVWKSSEDSTSTSLFAIDDLTILNSTLAFGNHEIALHETFASLQWANDMISAKGFGEIARFASPEWSSSNPLKWSASCIYGVQDGRLDLSMEEADFMGAKWTLDLTYEESKWAIAGETQQVAIRELINSLQPTSPWNRLRSEASASGKWSWEEGVFKSNWQITKGEWNVPFSGENPFDLTVDAEGKIWLKYELGQWRADLPSLEIHSSGLHWQGAVTDFLPDQGTFQAEGMGQIKWEDWNQMPQALQYAGLRPQTGIAEWDGNITANGSSAWSASGEWSANDWAGEYNATPWTLSGSGELNDSRLFSDDWIATWEETKITGSADVPNPLVQIHNGTSKMDLNVHLDHWAFVNEDSDSSSAIDLASLQLPGGADWTVHAIVDRLQYGLLALNSVEARGRLTPTRWSLNRFSSTTLGGSLFGDATIEFRSDQEALVAAHPTLSGCDLNELFFAFEDFDQKTLRSEHLTGTFGASGSVQFKWISNLAWQPQTLDVLGTATITEGTLKNLEAFDDISDYLKENRMMAPLVDPDDLKNRLKFVRFDELESAIYISNQSVQLPQVDIRTSAMNISLEGTYGFDESLDYTLGFAMRDLRNSRNDEFGDIEDDGLGQQFFIAMEGSLDTPEYRWDRDAQKNHRRENLQLEKELLKTLFRRKSN